MFVHKFDNLTSHSCEATQTLESEFNLRKTQQNVFQLITKQELVHLN